MALLLLAVPANAQYVEAVEIAVSDVTAQCPGQTLTVSGRIPTPRGEVTVLFDGEPVAGTTSDAKGGYSLTFPTPEGAGGTHSVTAVDETTAKMASATIVCVIAAAPGIAVTGGSIAVWMILLVGLIVVGAVPMVAGRRRSSRA